MLPVTTVFAFGLAGRISVDGGTLVIEKTQPSDAGVYYCEAGIAERNEVAFTNVTFSVKCKSCWAVVVVAVVVVSYHSANMRSVELTGLQIWLRNGDTHFIQGENWEDGLI